MSRQYLKRVTEVNELEKLDKLNKIARKINSVTELDDVLKLILQEGIRLLDVSYGDFWLVEKQTGDLVLLFTTHKGKLPKRKKRIKRGQGVCGWVVKNKKHAVISDVEWDKRYLRFLQGMKSELAFPLFFEEDVIGVMNFETEKENAFSGSEEELIHALAGHAVIAIRNAKLIEREKSFREIDKAILDSHLDLQTTLLVLLEKGLELLDTKKGQILLYDGKETLQIVASIPKKEIGRKLSIHNCVSGKAVKKGETIFVDDVSTEPLYKQILGEGIAAEMAAPLISDDETLGVFNIENSYGFSNDDKILFDTLAGQAAIAIKNAQLVRELQLKNKLVTAFKEVDDIIINPDFNFQDTLQVILEKVLSLLDTRKGQLLLRENDKLIISVTNGEVTDNNIKSITLDEGVCGFAARVKKHQIVPDVRQNKHYIKIIGNTVSEFAYPLLDKNGKVIGVFNAESPELDFFNEEHVKILDTVNNQISMAIQNAELQEVIKGLGEIISDINAAKSLDETLEKILDKALRLIKVPNGQLLEVDENKKELIIRVTRGKYDTNKADRFPIGVKGISSWVVKNKKPTRIHNVIKDPRYIGYLKNMSSELAVPLIADERVIGIINIESPELDFFTEQHEKVLSLLANGAALTMKNAKDRDRIKQLAILKNMGEYNERLLHWIGNKAAPILGCTNRILEDINIPVFEPDIKKSVKEDLEIIRKNSTLMLDIRKEFIGVTRELEVKPINLANILKESIKRKDITAKILDLHLEKDLPWAVGDERGIDMVLSNILQNALEALEGIEEKKLRIILKKDTQKNQLVLEITDNGCGISPKNISKIFQPFFTTKPKGNGIGLSISYEIISAMGGEMSVESEEQKGATFIIKLPIGGD